MLCVGGGGDADVGGAHERPGTQQFGADARCVVPVRLDGQRGALEPVEMEQALGHQHHAPQRSCTQRPTSQTEGRQTRKQFGRRGRHSTFGGRHQFVGQEQRVLKAHHLHTMQTPRVELRGHILRSGRKLLHF